MFENESHPSISGSADAPYMNQLIANGELFTNYFAVDTDGSFPNYLAMTSGNTAATAFSPNIFGAIDASGGALTWKEYMESMPSNCGGGTSGTVPGTTDTLYTADHDPALNFSPNVSCATNDVPLDSSFNPANLPDFSYIIPNECNDMHTLPTGGQACPAYYGSNTGTDVVNMGDNWLAHVVPQLLAQPNVTVLITFDEGGLDQGEHIATLLVGAGVTPGSTDNTLYDHYSLEAGLYQYFGLGVAPGLGATATPLPIPGLGGDVPSNPSGNTQPTFKFNDPDASASFQCSIDGSAFTGCTSPYQTPVLSDGSHTFAVRSIDSVGNASAATSYTWTVNTAPPTAPTIDTKPSDPSNNAQPSLGFSDSDSNVSFQCNIDGGSFSGCTSPFATGPLADGSHTFGVRSVNSLGTASAATTYTWTVDTTPPPAPSLTSTPPANDTSTSASFSFGDDEAGVTFECQLDAGSFSTCTSPATYSGLADGSHTFAVRARDARRQPELGDQLHLVVAGSAAAGAVDRRQALEPQQREAGGVRLLRHRRHGQLPVQPGRRRLQRLHQPVHDRRAGRRLAHVRGRGRRRFEPHEQPHAVHLDDRHGGTTGTDDHQQAGCDRRQRQRQLRLQRYPGGRRLRVPAGRGRIRVLHQPGRLQRPCHRPAHASRCGRATPPATPARPPATAGESTSPRRPSRPASPPASRRGR